MGYWIYVNDKTQGPLTLKEVKEKILSGEAIAGDLVTTNLENGRWVPLSGLPELQALEVPSRFATKVAIAEEFRRSCNSCGKVWHSLVSREVEIEKKELKEGLMQGATGLGGCATCGLSLGAAAQHSRNKELYHSEIERLRSCPQCGSKNYEEQIIQFQQ